MSSSNRVLAFASANPRNSDHLQGDASEAMHLLVGPSAAAAHLWDQIRRVAPHFRTALLTGEAHTGAEAVARALHDLSPATFRSFLALDPTGAEEFLGHRSVQVLPVEGTLFLSEIESLSRPAQTGLLRILRHRSQHPIRVIAFARNGLRAAVSAGTLSADLANALSAVRIALPPLRERSQDIPMILSHILHCRSQQLGRTTPTLAPDFLESAVAYAWPGNLHQMEALIQRLLQTAAGDILSASAFEAAVAFSIEHTPHPAPPARMIKLDQVIHEHIRSVLFGCNGNKLRAAEVLGISRSTLYRMLDASAAHPSIPLSLAG
jgi:DNA-binding NtrC family response regulator